MFALSVTPTMLLSFIQGMLFCSWPLWELSLVLIIAQHNMFSWFDQECNFSGLLELFVVHHSGGNRACWELVWLEYWKEFYFQEVKCFSSGHIDSFLIWNVSHTQHTFLDSDFHWDLQFHFKSPGDLFWVCVSFWVCSTAHILHWTDQILQGILGLICSQYCCLACIYQTPLRQSDGRKEKVIYVVPSWEQVQKELSWWVDKCMVYGVWVYCPW